MNYQDYFSSMPTANLAKDLLGRPFSYFDGQERLGYIVKLKPTWASKTGRPTLMPAAAARPTKAFMDRQAPSISTPSASTSSLTWLPKPKMSPRAS